MCLGRESGGFTYVHLFNPYLEVNLSEIVYVTYEGYNVLSNLLQLPSIPMSTNELDPCIGFCATRHFCCFLNKANAFWHNEVVPWQTHWHHLFASYLTILKNVLKIRSQPYIHLFLYLTLAQSWYSNCTGLCQKSSYIVWQNNKIDFIMQIWPKGIIIAVFGSKYHLSLRILSFFIMAIILKDKAGVCSYIFVLKKTKTKLSNHLAPEKCVP